MTDEDKAAEEIDPPETTRASGMLARHWQVWALITGVAIAAVVVTLSLAGVTHKPGLVAAGGLQRGHVVAEGHSHRVTHTLVPATTPEQVAVTMPLPRKLAVALREWKVGSGGAHLAKVAADLGEATQASGVRLFGPMRNACSGLASEVSAAKLSPAIPDAQTQGSYSAALHALGTAAAECRSAISVQAHGDEGLQTEEQPSLLHRSEADLAAGAKDLYQVTAKVAAAGRH
jgi:hypothetical protein